MQAAYKFLVWIEDGVWEAWDKHKKANDYTNELILFQALENMSLLKDGEGRKRKKNRHAIVTTNRELQSKLLEELKRTRSSESGELRQAIEDLIDE